MPALSSSALPPPANANLLSPPPLPPLPLGSEELPPVARRLLTAGVLAAHVVGLWGLMQIDSVRNAVAEVAPLMVDMIAPQAPPPPPPPPPPKPVQPVKLKAPASPPLVTATPTLAPSPTAFVAPPPPPEPVVVAQAEAPPAPTPPPAPPAPPALVRVEASALQYLAMPQLEFPRMSRRLGEGGTVMVRVIVDIQGTPRLVAVSRSSGFARLDEAALNAMRKARFKPHAINGRPVEVEAYAPFEFNLDQQ